MHLKNYCLLTALIGAWMFSTASAHTNADAPRLVVSITIDQLRSDYLQAFKTLYGERGFKRLMKEGYVCLNAEYPFVSPDRASSVACLFTGASPYENGIVSSMWMDRKSLRPVFCVDDEKYPSLPNGIPSSPRFLRSSTLVDELKMASSGASQVYAIAPFRDAAILAAGHAADGAFWLNDETGQWVTSSYYGGYPAWASAYERDHSLWNKTDNFKWTPSTSVVGQFNYLLGSAAVSQPFEHRFKGDNRIAAFKTTGCVNEEVSRFAKTCIENTALGKDKVTDFLSVTYYAGNFEHKTSADYPLELQDTYARLDRDLGEFIDYVEKRIGVGNVLFVVTSTGYSDPERPELARYRIPTGVFSMKKATALLNMYLIAMYGEGQYVETSYNAQIYLNKRLLEQKQLNSVEVLQRCQDFIIQLEGVQEVYTSHRLNVGSWNPMISKIRNAYHPKCSGDIMIDISSGWKLEADNLKEPLWVREGFISFPLFFLGYDVKSQIIKQPVSVDCVAPTVSQFMRIRAPNACAAYPLTDLK